MENTTSWAGNGARRDDVIDRSLVAVHVMLAIDGGRFVSLLDPPEGARGAVNNCYNDGTFPVLVGHDDIVLSSPIILYDHPEVAPESTGDLYDATEIDEILALRVLTLTEAEKSEARVTDPRAAAIIDRVDGFTTEMWGRLHGTVRSVGREMGSEEESPNSEQAIPWWDPAAEAAADPSASSIDIAGVEVRMGTRVRLHPSHRADAQDLFLHGLAATVAGIFTDVDGEVHVAVDCRRRPGHRGAELAGSLPVLPSGRGIPGRGRPTAGKAITGKPVAGKRRPRMSASVLVAGIGNIFLGDDGFGVEVANRLAAEAMPAGAKVADFGIRGVHLAYELLEGYEGVVLVDAVPMGEEPGTVAIIKATAPRASRESDSPLLLDAHSMSPDVVLATLCRLGGSIDNVYVVGCQPASLEAGIGSAHRWRTPLTAPWTFAASWWLILPKRNLKERRKDVRKNGDVPSALFLPSYLALLVGLPGGEVAARYCPVLENAGDVTVGAPVPDSARTSYVWINARSNLHPIHSKTDGLEGFVDLELTPGGDLDLASTPAGQLSLAVRRLSSGSAMEDREMQRRIDAQRYPRIEGVLEGDGPIRWRRKLPGQRRRHFSGRGPPLPGRYDDGALDADTVQLAGKSRFDIRDFGMEPPRVSDVPGGT